MVEGFHGRPFEKPLTHVRDVIRAVRTLLAGGKLSDAGAELAAYRPFTLEMKPARPAIPIYVAALKQKSIESIGELADGWIPTFWPYERLAEGHAWIAAGAARAGRDPASITTAPFTPVLPLGLMAGTVMAKRIISFYIGGMGDYYIELLTHFGFAEECKRIADLYEDKATRAQAADAVPAKMIEALTISGDPAHCIEELKRRRSFGIDLPILNLPNGMPWEMVEMFIRSMAPGAGFIFCSPRVREGHVGCQYLVDLMSVPLLAVRARKHFAHRIVRLDRQRASSAARQRLLWISISVPSRCHDRLLWAESSAVGRTSGDRLRSATPGSGTPR